MNNWIKKNFNILLIIFILLQPILDLITGLGIHIWHVNITLGIMIRMLFLGFILYSVLFVYKKKVLWKYYGLLIIYGIFYILGIVFYKDGAGLFSEIQGLCRVFYFPVLLLALYGVKDEIKVSNMTLIVVLITYLVCILVPNCLNMGFESYEITKKGTLGFFNSANEISGIISLLTPIMIIILVTSKKILPTILISILYLAVILTIGTKSPLLSLGITVGFAYLWFIYKKIKNKQYKAITISLIALVVAVSSLMMILPRTNFYKNIKTHLNYLKVDNVGEVLEKKELIDHFIFSQRLTFLKNRQRDYVDASAYQKLFGIGYLNGTNEAKAIEMDYFDIYYSQGIIGFVLYFAIYGSIFYLIMKKRKKLDFEQYMLYVSILLSIFLSFFTGHIITAPAVSILVAVLLLKSEKKKPKLLFTAYDLNIGGIEKSLINLVNKINLDKYAVEIVLENKKGILLDKIKEEILVKEFKVNNNQNKMIRKVINLTKRIFFCILNYNTYDFSCCYATYSLSGNKLSKIASRNNSIYIHSNYKYIYPQEKDFKNFFDSRKIINFKHPIFVSNEAKKDFLAFYPHLIDKSLVFNNFIDQKEIIAKSNEKITEKKPKDKKLFVFVGRLDDTSKKVSRAINLVKELKEIELWIIGDGPDRKMYEEKAEKNKVSTRVKFMGSKVNPYPYMKLADYIILTSDYEGFPVTYLEAIALKVPIITTIDVSDDEINIGKDYANIISKEEGKMKKEVAKILESPKRVKAIDLEKIEARRMKNLEKLFDEVI